MKVMYVIDSLHGGGAETSLVELAGPLRDRGIELTVVTLLDDDSALRPRVEALGLETLRLRARSWGGWVRQLRSTMRLRRPDLVHTSLLRADVCARAAAVAVDVPVVTSLVNSSYGPEHRRQSRYGPWAVRGVQILDAITARRTDLFHAISHDVAHVMARRLRIDPSRIEVVYRGRDAERLGRFSMERRAAARTGLGLNPETPLVLAVGRLDRQKAIDVALRAFARISHEFPSAQMLVAGREGNATELVHAAARGVPRVRFLGHRADVADLLCAADCLVFPSRWEGLGGTLIEALALETPIVASDLAPIREVMGDIGWPRVAVEDEVGIAAAVRELLRGGAEVAARREAARRRFENMFTVQAAAEGMQRLYGHVIARRRR